jgi:hypothetical protein
MTERAPLCAVSCPIFHHQLTIFPPNSPTLRGPIVKEKPSWGFFLTWLIVYTILDMILEVVLHGHLAWSQLPGAIEGAILGATLTWFFALFRWYKAQDRF